MKSNRTMKVKINKKHPPTVFENLSGVSLCFLWFNFYYPQERVFGDFSDKDIRPWKSPFYFLKQIYRFGDLLCNLFGGTVGVDHRDAIVL